MLVAIIVILVLGFAAVLTLVVGIGIQLAGIHDTLEFIMSDLDNLSSILDDIMGDVTEAAAHAADLEAQLKTAQDQLTNNQTPDLSVVIQKATAIRQKLEGVQGTVSDAGASAPGAAGGDAQGASGEPAQGAGNPGTDTPSVGDAADGDVVSPGTTGGRESQEIGGDDVGAMPAEITSGTVDASAAGTSHDTEATAGSQSAGDQQAAAAPSEQPQEADAAQTSEVTGFDPEREARDPSQG